MAQQTTIIILKNALQQLEAQKTREFNEAKAAKASELRAGLDAYIKEQTERYNTAAAQLKAQYEAQVAELKASYDGMIATHKAQIDEEAAKSAETIVYGIETNIDKIKEMIAALEQ